MKSTFLGKIGLFATMIVLFLVTSQIVEAQEQVFTGTIYTYTDDDGMITEAEMEVATLESAVYYSIQLDEKSRKLVKENEGCEVEVTGSLVTKDDEELLVIKSIARVLVGTILVTKDSEGKLQNVQLRCEGEHSFTISIADASRKIAMDMAGKAVRVVGMLNTKSGEETFDIKSCREFISGRGHLEIDENEEGEVTAIRFARVRPEGAKAEFFEIRLDSEGRKLAELFANEDIELSGIIQPDAKGKRWLSVLKCDYTEMDEEMDDEEIDEGGDGGN